MDDKKRLTKLGAKMKRLTKFNANHEIYRLPECEDEAACGEVCVLCRYVTKAINRLGELEDKLEDGQLVELSCKVGDQVYYLDPNVGKIEVYTIDAICCNKKGWYFTVDDEDHFEHYFNDKSEIGVTVFFDKSVAETRLKELQEE